MDSATMWTAIGSVGTGVAVIIAAVTLFVMQWQSTKETREGRAAELREIIRSFEAASSELISILLDGSTILAASDETIRCIRHGLGDSPSVSELWMLLADDSQVLNAATTGWTASPVAADLRKARAAMAATSERLSGELNVLSSAGHLVAGIADDGYSPRIFTLLLSEEGLESFRRDNGHLPLNRLLWKLTGHLQSNTSLYFAARYSQALNKINEFIQVAARTLSSLDAKNLELAARQMTAVQPKNTFTDDIRANLDRIQPLMSDDLTSRLRQLLDEVEHLVAKDGALDRAAAIKDMDGEAIPAEKKI